MTTESKDKILPSINMDFTRLLHRVLEEKTADTIKLQERISRLNHQVQHFKNMNIFFQKEVINELIEDVIFYTNNSQLNWYNILDQLKKIQKEYDQT